MNMSRDRKHLIEEEIKPIKYRNCLYKMKIAQYEVEVNCSKKKEGRQLAAQRILKQMHPHIQTWGSILRLYSSNQEDALLLKCEKDEKENEGSKNDDNACQKSKPNHELLDRLKEEMRKLKRKTLNTEQTKNMDTLLTIPPLLLNECNKNDKETEKSEPEANKNEDDVIKFNSIDKKRKLSKSDESDTTESSSSSLGSTSLSDSSSNSSESE